MLYMQWNSDTSVIWISRGDNFKNRGDYFHPQCETELSQETSATLKEGGQGPVSLIFVHMQIGSEDSNKAQAGSFSSHSS